MSSQEQIRAYYAHVLTVPNATAAAGVEERPFYVLPQSEMAFCSACYASRWAGAGLPFLSICRGCNRRLVDPLGDQTLVLIKPDGVRKGLTAEKIIDATTSLRPVGVRTVVPTLELAREHYAEHAGKDFYEKICHHLSSGQIVAIVFEGPDAVRVIRERMKTVLRPNYSTADKIEENAIHGSDSDESARREVALWFPLLPK